MTPRLNDTHNWTLCKQNRHLLQELPRWGSRSIEPRSPVTGRRKPPNIPRERSVDRASFSCEQCISRCAAVSTETDRCELNSLTNVACAEDAHVQTYEEEVRRSMGVALCMLHRCSPTYATCRTMCFTQVPCGVVRTVRYNGNFTGSSSWYATYYNADGDIRED